MKRIWLCFVAIVLHLTTSPAPAQDMPLTQVLLPGQSWRVLTEGLGLAVDAKGDLFVSRPGEKVVEIYHFNSREPLVHTSGEVSGLAVDREGNLFGCQPAEGRIVRLGPAKETTVAEKLPGVRHLVITRTGVIYCTQPSDNVVVRIDKLGERKTVAEGIKSPTGLALWKDEGTLVVAEGAGAHLWAFRIEQDGSLTHKERYYPLRVRPTKTSHAGGLTVDDKGRLYAATDQGVQVFDPTGRLCGVLLRPENGHETGVVLAGPERNMLVLACGNKLYVRKTLAKGIR